MKQINRLEFLGALYGNSALPDEKVKMEAPVNEFANKVIPQFDSRANTGLTQYSGPFGTTQIAHLLRRCLFGVTKADIDAFAGMTLDQAIVALTTASATPLPPVNTYNNANFTDADVPVGQTWVNTVMNTNSVNANGRRKVNFKQWWVGLMLNQERNLTEKMTLFWHNHFATQLNIYNDARGGYKHIALLRANAFGNFKTLTRLVTTDAAMLDYLNGRTNTKNAPNENYARELQELFTVGKGPDSHYTEDDVKAAARVLTGWRVDVNTLTAYFDSTKHDTTAKQFSAFYGNATIAGQSGANGANETDQLIDMIFLQQEAAKHISRKLYRWFVYYVIDAQVETDIITPMSDLIVQNNWEIMPALVALLKSEHFFDTLNFGCHIKNPLDHLVGVCRQFNIAFPTSANTVDQYKGWGIVADALLTLGMDAGDPPNVAGWPAYYQEPQFHEQWINSDTLPSRNEYTDALCSLSGVTRNGVNLKIDCIAFAQQFANAGDPNLLITDSAALLSPNDIGPTQTAFLKSILLSGQAADHYWTDAWDDYIGDPSNVTFKTAVETRLRSMYTYLMDMAEYQLI
ncbi:MAG TPA: DUF1800 domain-containing protein [Chitinophagales bacterium]|nr:DUF1800 domain-containing protein [Chitinophagales bacterium]